MVCSSPTIKNVHLYTSSDISLISHLRMICQRAAKKCTNQTCMQLFLNHTFHYFHQDGYIEMRTRVPRSNLKTDEINTIFNRSLNKPVNVQVYCDKSKKDVFEKTEISNQLQEMSFYSFLEQFFYNNSNLALSSER